MEERSLVRLSTALESRVHGLRHTFSDKEQQVANFLLSDPKEFVSLSISALAARCGVSETVIIRLYRKLGYDGFHQFKIDIAQSLTEATQEVLGDLGASDDMETIKRKVFATTAQALEDSLAAVDSEMLTRASQAIQTAHRVLLIGYGGSAPVAMDFAHKLLKLGILANVQVDSHMQIMSTQVMGPGDLVLAVSHSGGSRDIVEALQAAKQRGIQTVAVTGIPHSPAAKVADISLCTACRETQYQTDAMTSRVVQMTILDTIYVSLIFADKEKATANIHDTSLAAARKKL